jgi:hypothetical protein
MYKPSIFPTVSLPYELSFGIAYYCINRGTQHSRKKEIQKKKESEDG